MTLQVRPTEVRKVAELLSQEHEDVDSLARQVIDLLDSLRAEREAWVLCEIHPTLKVARAIGLYGTEKQAMKDVPLLTQYDTESRAYLCRFHDSAKVQSITQ